MSLIAGSLIGFFTPHPRGRAIVVTTPDPTATSLPTPTPAPLRVYVSGAVTAADVYLLPPGSLVDDALRAAGGPAVDADLERINLARELTDQQQVYVPRRGEGDAPPTLSDGVAPTAAPTLLDINSASAAELEALPHVGPTTAQRIVEYRTTYGPFAAIEELTNVPGIGPTTLEELRDWITVAP